MKTQQQKREPSPGKTALRTVVRSTITAKKVVVDFPASLYDEAESVSRELAINRSVLVRKAVEQYLSAFRQQKLEQELAAGYVANAELDRQVSEDFAWIQSEHL